MCIRDRYADDSKMYRVISTQQDLSSFQIDRDKISDWCKMNKMRINAKKCKIMRITKKKSPLVREYNVEGQPLESVKSECTEKSSKAWPQLKT